MERIEQRNIDRKDKKLGEKRKEREDEECTLTEALL